MGPPVRAAVRRQAGPADGGVDGDHLDLVVGEVVDEVVEEQLGAGQFEPDRPADLQIDSEVLAQAAHECAPIGQGNANGRSDRSSTLA